MNQSLLPIVEDIAKDLETVPKWELSSGQPASTTVVLAHFKGEGERWSHNLVVWTDEHGDHPDGAAISKTDGKGLIVRYTPDIGMKIIKLLKEGGHLG